MRGIEMVEVNEKDFICERRTPRQRKVAKTPARVGDGIAADRWNPAGGENRKTLSL